jgi:hypothetical protein
MSFDLLLSQIVTGTFTLVRLTNQQLLHTSRGIISPRHGVQTAMIAAILQVCVPCPEYVFALEKFSKFYFGFVPVVSLREAILAGVTYVKTVST